MRVFHERMRAVLKELSGMQHGAVLVYYEESAFEQRHVIELLARSIENGSVLVSRCSVGDENALRAGVVVACQKLVPDQVLPGRGRAKRGEVGCKQIDVIVLVRFHRWRQIVTFFAIYLRERLSVI